MSDQINSELWDFPCSIAFKAMANNKNGIEQGIVEAIESVVPGNYNPHLKPSRNGKYVSVTVSIHFEEAKQVEDVYRAVRALADIKMCL